MCASANARGNRSKKETKSNQPTGRIRTLWSYYFEGNVEIPEICIHSINQQCPDEKNGCKRLHAKKKWHWQLMYKRNWYNFLEAQSDRLERAFQLEETNEVMIPSLSSDFFKTGKQMQELVRLLGTYCWRADFEQMIITKYDHDDTFNIRRLSTSSTEKFKSKYSTVFRWFFQEDGSWIEFGQCRKTSPMNQVLTTSYEIEERYQKDPDSFMTVKVSNSKWKLDFSRMEFTDEKSSKILPVRRRPKDDDLVYPTVWAYYLQGEVEKAEICMDTIGDKCAVGNGCGRLHTDTVWHWQFMHNGIWYNMPKLQREAIEDAYLDVSKYTTELPLINPEKMGKLGVSLSKILGLKKWIAEFDNMTIARSDDLKKTLPLRRLSTPSSLGSSDKRARPFVWFFRDKNGSWVEFESSGDVSEASWDSVVTSSDDIEKCYQSRKKDVIDVSTEDGEFELNFSSMKLCNNSTKEEMPVRRRPKSSMATSNQKESKINKDVRITYKVTSEEKKEVQDLLLESLDPQEILNITRIQNPRIRDKFNERQNEIAATDKKRVMNIQTLFHWVPQEVVDDICRNNFEWRHQCPGMKSLCTLGVSFFKRAEFIHKECCVSRCARDHRLLVFKVLVGKLRGSKTKPSSRDVCSTEVDNVNSPTRYVKYDKSEYSPVYIIQI